MTLLKAVINCSHRFTLRRSASREGSIGGAPGALSDDVVTSAGEPSCCSCGGGRSGVSGHVAEQVDNEKGFKGSARKTGFNHKCHHMRTKGEAKRVFEEYCHGYLEKKSHHEDN